MMYTKRLLVIGYWLWFAGSVSLLQAQNLEDSIRTVTVEAEKIKKEITSSAPQYSLDEEDMLQRGVTDIADALHRFPGIVLRDYGGAGGMKTVSVRGFGSQHTGVSYDGVMLSDCQTGQIDLQRYSLNDLSNIRLNIGDGDNIFVPARNLSAPALLELESTPNTQHSTLNTKLTIGSWGMVNPFVNYDWKVSEKSRLSALVDYIFAENNYPFTLKNGNTETEEHRTNSRMAQFHSELNYQLKTQNSKLNTKFYYYDNSRDLPGIVHYYTNDNDETLHETNVFGQMQYRWHFHKDLTFMGNAKWNWARSKYHNGKPSGGISSSEYFQREGYGSVALLYTPLHNLSFDYSGDYVFNSLNGSISQSGSVNRHTMLHAWSGKWQFWRMKIVGRFLWSNIWGETKNENQLSPSFNASFKVMENKNLYLRASYKNIFRMPSFNEQYFFHLGSQNLKPETTNQFNLGVTDDIRINDFHIQGTVDGYYNNVHDKIVCIPKRMFVWQNENLAKVDVYGMDVALGASYDINRLHTVGISGNYSLQRVMNTTNSESKSYKNQIAYTPLHSGSITLMWKNPWANFSITGDGMSERWSTNEHSEDTRLDGFTEWAVNAVKEFRVQGLEFRVQAAVLNIFNKQYDIVAHYPMPGRNYRISVNLKL